MTAHLEGASRAKRGEDQVATIFGILPGVDAASPLSRIASGSGIVGVQREGGYRLYFEGNLNGAVNLNSLEERIQCAAGRLFTRYPTVAMTYVPQEDAGHLHPIGEVTWDASSRQVSVHIDHDALAPCAQFIGDLPIDSMDAQARTLGHGSRHRSRPR